MVEVAVALPFLIAIVAALVEMGIVFASYVALVNAASQGAVFASMHPELVDTADCNPDNLPNAYPLDEGTAGYCTGANDDLLYGGGITSSITTTVWMEYYNRVANEVLIPIGEGLKRGQLLTQDDLTVYRPVPQPSCSTNVVMGCQITVTVVYTLHTLTSDMSLPYFGRFGLPNSYQLKYNMSTSVR